MATRLKEKLRLARFRCKLSARQLLLGSVYASVLILMVMVAAEMDALRLEQGGLGLMVTGFIAKETY